MKPVCYTRNAPVTTRYHLHPLCFIEKSNHYPSLPYVTSLLHKKFARYHLLPLASILFPLEFCFRKKSMLPAVTTSVLPTTQEILLLPLVTTLFPQEIQLLPSVTSRYHM